MKSEPSRTFIGSVVCIDLVGYSKRTVDEQIAIKEVFNRLLSQVIRRVRTEDRIILDTGDGAAVSFLGDPEECLDVSLDVRDAMNAAGDSLGATGGQGPVRIGLNLGPLKVAVDLNGRPNIIGDGLNVAERVMSFAQPGQIVSSRSFHDMVSRLSSEREAMFRFEGKHTDRNSREHEIYLVEDPRRIRAMAVAKTAAARSAAANAAPPAPPATLQPRGAPAQETPAVPAPPAAAAAAAATPARAPGGSTRAQESAFVAFLRSPVKVGITAAALVALIFAEAWMLDRKNVVPSVEASAAAPGSPATPAPEAKASAPATTPAPSLPMPGTGPTRPAPAPAVAEAPAQRKPDAASPAPTSPAAPAKPDPVPSRLEPGPARPERARQDPPAAPKVERVPEQGSPAAAAQAAREKAAEARSGARRAEDPRVAVTRPSMPFPASPPEPALPAPTPAPDPSAQPPAQVAAVAPVTRVPVVFPRVAAQQGIESGTVRARLTIGADGRVTDVRILGSSPARVFDREAVRALEQWRFNTGADRRTYEVEIAFKR